MASRLTRTQARYTSSTEGPEPSTKKRKTDTKGTNDDADSKGSSTKEMQRDINPEPAPAARGIKYDDEELLGRDEVVSLYVTLDPLPARAPRVASLTADELHELERALELNDGTDNWRNDWAGNLALIDKEVGNPKVKDKGKQAFRQTLLDWAQKNPDNVRLVWNLMRLVCNFSGTPDSAKKVLACADPKSLASLEKAIRRTTYDPVILQQDGWITAKSAERVGATGGPNLIGDLIRWQHLDAVVIAYDHDELIGDLWKAMWLEHSDFMSFDVEAEELLEAKRKWERRQAKQGQPTSDPSGVSRRSMRVAVSSDFNVKGIESGIVLARSLSKGSRPGVYWPARIMHVSEAIDFMGKRSSSKAKVDVVFLSPYWNSDDAPVRSRRVESLSESGYSAFNAGSLLQFESIDATEEMIREYPYNAIDGVDINKLRTAFRFTGLPRAAFPRFLDSHRLALALQSYASRNLNAEVTETDIATAGLFHSHPMAIRTANFPPVVLNLPFEHILSNLPHPDGEYQASHSDNGQGELEPLLSLESVVRAMRPPHVFGQVSPNSPIGNRKRSKSVEQSTPGVWLRDMNTKTADEQKDVGLEHIFENLEHLNEFLNLNVSSHAVTGLLRSTRDLMSFIASEKSKSEDSADSMRGVKELIGSWSTLKRLGVDVVSLLQPGNATIVADWRRASERLYKYIASQLKGFPDGLSVVITDFRCNGHITSSACFERCVRLPAALKGAKLAGASNEGSPKLVVGVSQHFFDLAESEVLRRAHGASYLKRMKSRCAAAASDDDVVKLTDDSDGNGGEDTMGSRGTWNAAICAVAAAMEATDMIVRGACVNAFCATRPPGHHAGRSLHPMKAVSNGFCVLNAVACTAIYATMPLSEGGLGLSRVCVIDFDAHHGNGTQDILCSTFDSRYLYVSMHAGGPEVNGVSHEDDPNHELHDLATSKSGGIFPGRCGDTSPHKGVLNIPLGGKVTSHDVGTALIRLVSPAVESFAPDLIILSAGFDAHKNDPMGLGSLSADDFGHITEVACQLAYKVCSGRVLSVLEGGYGVPCCRPQRGDLLLPNIPAPAVGESSSVSAADPSNGSVENGSSAPARPQRPQPSLLLDLGADLPSNMDDQVPYGLQRRLEKCHAEGFVECVRKHVESLARCNKRK